MGLDLSLAGFIGAGGGLAYVLLAILLAASRGHTRARLLLAGLLGAQGLSTMAQSLTRPDQPSAGALEVAIFAIVLGTRVVAGIFSVILALHLARETSRTAVRTTWGALAVLAILALVAIAAGGITPAKGDPAAMPPVVRIIYVAMLVSYGASTVTFLAMGLHWRRSALPQTPVLAIGVALVPVPILAWGLTRSVPETLLGCFAVACILTWAPPWAHGSREGLATFLGLLAWALLAEASRVLPALSGLRGEALGPFEVLAALAMAIAVLRHRAWTIEPPRFAARQGPAAAAALATLLIVAQIAENFLDARYGVLMGGIVAGAMLFAASPVQRAMERIAEGRTTAAASTPAHASAPDAKREAYRRALRLALRDRALTRAEEVELAHIAHELGLSAPEAVALRHEVEEGRT